MRNLNLLQFRPGEAIESLRQISVYKDLNLVITAWKESNSTLSENILKELDTLTNFETFIEARLKHQIEPLQQGERELEFRLRLYGMDEGLRRDWLKFIGGLDTMRDSARIKYIR